MAIYIPSPAWNARHGKQLAINPGMPRLLLARQHILSGTAKESFGERHRSWILILVRYVCRGPTGSILTELAEASQNSVNCEIVFVSFLLKIVLLSVLAPVQSDLAV